MSELTEQEAAEVAAIRSVANEHRSICINMVDFTTLMKADWDSNEWLIPITGRDVLMSGLYAHIEGTNGPCKVWVSMAIEPGTIRTSEHANPTLPNEDNYTNWADWSEPMRLVPELESETSALGTGLLVAGALIGAAITAACKSADGVRVSEAASDQLEDQSEDANETAR